MWMNTDATKKNNLDGDMDDVTILSSYENSSLNKDKKLKLYFWVPHPWRAENEAQCLQSPLPRNLSW